MISGIASLLVSCRCEKDSCWTLWAVQRCLLQTIHYFNWWPVVIRATFTLPCTCFILSLLSFQVLTLTLPLEVSFLKCCSMASCPCRHAVMNRRVPSAGPTLMFFRFKTRGRWMMTLLLNSPWITLRTWFQVSHTTQLMRRHGFPTVGLRPTWGSLWIPTQCQEL